MGIQESHAELLDVWADYRNGIYEGNADKLAAIFHPAASMFYVTKQDIVVTPIADYIEIVRNRVAPQKSGARRDERLVSLAVPSVDSAVLTATILIMGKSYTDQLTMMKQHDKWLIVAKTYHLDSDAGA
jgi:hypothetical protein